MLRRLGLVAGLLLAVLTPIGGVKPAHAQCTPGAGCTSVADYLGSQGVSIDQVVLVTVNQPMIMNYGELISMINHVTGNELMDISSVAAMNVSLIDVSPLMPPNPYKPPNPNMALTEALIQNSDALSTLQMSLMDVTVDTSGTASSPMLDIYYSPGT